MPLITDSETDDFEAAIVQAGFDLTDFDARQLLHLPRTKVVTPDIATVVVRRISTDIAEIYMAGSGSIWPQVFEADLQAGNFGEP